MSEVTLYMYVSIEEDKCVLAVSKAIKVFRGEKQNGGKTKRCRAFAHQHGRRVQGCIARKKPPPPPWHHHRSPGMVLLQGPTGWRFLISEAVSYKRSTHVYPSTETGSEQKAAHGSAEPLKGFTGEFGHTPHYILTARLVLGAFM